ncbi:MAG: sulfatase-like hydrolase/transferase, partial [Prevotella sp.]|nr:sulfatase-like hydrolase/transferase [Prevotella sp.]
VRNDKLHVFDEGLLSDYDNLNVNDVVNVQPNLFIFHLMGQHVNYRIRCPNSKKRWGADTYPNDMDMPARRRKMMADYDNAVWYNDSVVNQIVERFKKQDAVIIYMPDHGEEVFGPGARHFCGRMHDAVITKRLADEEFRIPMWIYCTPKYRRNHPEVFRAIKRAKGKKYMTDATSHLLLGLAGIHSKYYRPEYDLLSPQYNADRKRIIKNTVDYDTIK